MADLNETPRGNRIHIAFFGLRNAGKSTLVNAFIGQDLAIVSPTPGTTTDPVSKAMEILPLGPCLITDTAGLDDTGELGRQRVEKTLAVLATTDIAVWVGEGFPAWKEHFRVPVIVHPRGASVEDLRRKISEVGVSRDPALMEGLVRAGDRVVCVCPIDASAPRGRLILPQVQVVRACLDAGAVCTVCQPAQLAAALRDASGAKALVVTDSQAFAEVRRILGEFPDARLTSFSILFARQKGDLSEYARGIAAIGSLVDGDTVLIAEGCTHHRQCNDIGTVKIPKALAKLSGRRLDFIFASGGAFIPADVRPRLVVQCGGCMLTRREVLRRIDVCRASGVPIVNYGLLLAAAAGILPRPDSCLVK